MFKMPSALRYPHHDAKILTLRSTLPVAITHLMLFAASSVALLAAEPFVVATASVPFVRGAFGAHRMQVTK